MKRINVFPKASISTIFIRKNALTLIITLLISACASKTTLEKYQAKADEGNVKEQLILADSYFYGTKDLARNKEKAIEYYRLAADNGSDSAAFNLGIIYQKDKLYSESVYYYEIAAEAGNPKAQDNLGILYHHGIGIEQNWDKAEQLYLSALENGSQYSQRNLAILYKDSGQALKAIEAFKTLAFSETSDNIPYKFKSGVAQTLMDLYLDQSDLNKAYIWGSTAILSGLFDSKIKDANAIKERYEGLQAQLTKTERKSLIKDILVTHYNSFQQFEKTIERYEEFLISDGLIKPPTDKLINLTGYKIHYKKDIYQGINQFKGKDDKKSRINFALYNLKMSAYEVSLGAISPHFHSAKSYIEESLEILDDYTDKNLAFLKQTTTLKLAIVQDAAAYQKSMLTK
ncbi:sel1 repeat family protein [Marinomonas sp. C2222]|uniref:Sel1 repeat family protein n=1 Tax=Marinomonas sargassi TaxID=2984494 RepID=A0ABT2YRH6_9GAMM|nr:tetratricopeptide repeat protein [Marinomonas sargassi]MCV2402471.1 sel1 repeat family protein [Marinomonas sargassi]